MDSDILNPLARLSALTGFFWHVATDDARQIAEIQNDLSRKQWDLIGKMQDEQSQMNEQNKPDQRYDAALSKSYCNMSELRH